MDLPSLSTQLRTNAMRYSSNFSSQMPCDSPPRRQQRPRSFDSVQAGMRPPGICVARSLPDSEFENIRRCFQRFLHHWFLGLSYLVSSQNGRTLSRANTATEGYLNCSELKTYMDLRKCPITQWEAEKLLEYADPTYHYYITLEQVLPIWHPIPHNAPCPTPPVFTFMPDYKLGDPLWHWDSTPTALNPLRV